MASSRMKRTRATCCTCTISECGLQVLLYGCVVFLFAACIRVSCRYVFFFFQPAHVASVICTGRLDWLLLSYLHLRVCLFSLCCCLRWGVGCGVFCSISRIFCRGTAREAGAAARDRDQDALREGKGHFHATANPFGARGAHQDLW